MKKKIYNLIENLNKEELIKEGLMILVTIILYLLSYMLDVIDCVIFYLLIRIITENIVEKINK